MYVCKVYTAKVNPEYERTKTATVQKHTCKLAIIECTVYTNMYMGTASFSVAINYNNGQLSF